MRDNQNTITNNYLQFCYTCQEAHQCENEKKCLACWEEKGIAAKEEYAQTTTTEDFLRLYAE
ncbi:hypothetical protein [Cohnella sp. WQ 127256]|uniref:hypothetical protein n=1 Tax=Cohnella sp. WQ 127256 TaxID=2938790 RepID=UPI002117637F|nr:hypothetical protein [Cohnella sp. WQ 127256]